MKGVGIGYESRHLTVDEFLVTRLVALKRRQKPCDIKRGGGGISTTGIKTTRLDLSLLDHLTLPCYIAPCAGDFVLSNLLPSLRWIGKQSIDVMI